MKYYVEESLRNFKFWNGAKDTVDELTLEDLDIIESCLDDGGEWSDTAINDFFWFENDTIAEWLGYSSWERMLWERGGGQDKAQNVLIHRYPKCSLSYIGQWVEDNWDMNLSDEKNAEAFEQDAISDYELSDPDEQDEDED